MMDICTDGNVQDMEMEKLKEKYFKGLLEQLKINEKHQVDQDSLLLEMSQGRPVGTMFLIKRC